MGDEKQTEKSAPSRAKSLERHAVEMLLSIRSAYLLEVGGKPTMGYWAQLQSRARAAAMQTTTANEWVSSMQRRMQIQALHKDASRVLTELVKFCDENDAHLDFLSLVERDHALLIALTQQIVEEQKSRKNEG